MSHLFSYELDERQIRILMKDAQVEYSEDAWRKYEEIDNIGNESSARKFLIPKVDFGISRSIVVPVFFVVMIIALSALLFSFVDFKKKEQAEKETSFTNDIKPEKVIITKPKVVTQQKPATNNLSLENKISTTQNVKINHTQSENAQKEQIVKKEESNLHAKTSHDSKKEELKNNKNEEPTLVTTKKKRKRKSKSDEESEELPIIHTPISNLNNTSDEPELKLK